jgi:hypothetical protein
MSLVTELGGLMHFLFRVQSKSMRASCTRCSQAARNPRPPHLREHGPQGRQGAPLWTRGRDGHGLHRQTDRRSAKTAAIGAIRHNSQFSQRAHKGVRGVWLRLGGTALASLFHEGTLRKGSKETKHG